MLALVSSAQAAIILVANIFISKVINFQHPVSSWGQSWLASRSCGLSHKV
jgi:hypothetical protein